MGETLSVSSKAAAQRTVHEHYDNALKNQLSARGWEPHLDKVAGRATANGARMTLRRVVSLAWRRRRWPHTGPHHWKRSNGQRVCTTCAAALKKLRLNPGDW